MNYPECLPENIAEKLRNVDGVTEVRLRDGQAAVGVTTCATAVLQGKFPGRSFLKTVATR